MMNFAQYVTKLILKTMEQLFNDLRQQIAGTMGGLPYRRRLWPAGCPEEWRGTISRNLPLYPPQPAGNGMEQPEGQPAARTLHPQRLPGLRLPQRCPASAARLRTHAGGRPAGRMPARLAVRRMQLATDTPHQQILCPARRDKGIRNGVLHERGRAVFRIATTGVPVPPAGAARAGRHWR